MGLRLLLVAVALGVLAVAGACSDTSPAYPAGGQPRNSLAEAAAATGASPQAAEGTGIRGRAVIWPSCPAESGQPECAPKPLAARIAVLRSEGQRVATLGADNDGWFQVTVPPGAYVIQAEAEGMLCASVDVTVPGHGYTDVTVRCDTGVR